MRRILTCLCLAIFTFCSTAISHAADPPVKALRFGKLVDGKGKVWTDAIVIVRGERIADITTDASKIPAGAEVIDLRRYTAIPGINRRPYAHHLLLGPNLECSSVRSAERFALAGCRRFSGAGERAPDS